MTDEQLMKHIVRVARTKYRLHVWQWLPQHVGGHSAHSLHYQKFPGTNTGRAFDAYRTSLSQARYARWLRRHHKARLTEVIYNGLWTKVSIKNGRDVPHSTWGAATWQAHTNHVHVGI